MTAALLVPLHALLLTCSVASAQEAAALPAPVVIEEAPDAEFNLTLPVRFTDDQAQTTVVVRFDEQEGGDWLELRLTRESVTLAQVRAEGEKALAGPAPLSLDDQGTATVTLRRRADGVSVLAGAQRVLAAWPEATPGKLSLVAPQGVVDPAALAYQPYAAPEFTDDFMRAETESTGDWEVVSGKWENTALVDSLRFVPRAANSFAFAAHPASPALAAAGEAFWDDYRCAVSARVPDRGTAGLAFRVQDVANHYLLSVRFGSPQAEGKALLTLKRVTGGAEQVLAQQARVLPHGQWYRLAALLDGRRIEAFLDDEPVIAVSDDTFSQGRVGLFAADCETVYFDDAEVGPCRKFADDFEEDGLARWQTVQGEWQALPAGAAGGLCLAKRPDGAALSVTGHLGWADYEYRAQVRPGRQGTCGLAFCWTAPEDYYLWRWRAGRQQLVHVLAGAETVLDEAAMPLPGKDWTTVRVRVRRDYVSASANGGPAVEALLPRGAAGKVGVFADRGSRAAFDNVRVAFPVGYVPPTLPETMLTDAEMKEQFANPAEGWFQVGSESTQPQKVGMNWNKGEYFGPVDITFPLTNVVAAAGKVRVTLDGDQTAPGGGYGLLLSKEANSPRLHLALSRNGEPVAAGDAEIDAQSGTCQVRLGRRGSFVIATIDDKPIVVFREGREAVGSPPVQSGDKVQADG